MIKRYEKNPNTAERLDDFYRGYPIEKERFNDWMIPMLEPLIPKNGGILEVGCGYGKTLNWIKKLGKNNTLVGVDISKVAIDGGKEHYDGLMLICKDFTNDEELGKYDLIINSQTLEHVDDPEKMILKMKDSLNPKGVIFITVPYPKSNLDRGVKLHHWTFYPQDFIKILGKNCLMSREGNHLIVIYEAN